MKKKLIKIMLLVLVLGSFTGCSTSKKIYGEQYNFNYVKPTENIEANFYSYSKNVNREVEKFDNVEFIQNKMSYSYHDYKKTKPDKDGNIIVNVEMDVTGTIEYYSTRTEKYYYSYFYTIPIFFDYYTGYTLTAHMDSSDGSTKIYQNGEEDQKDKEKYQFTEIDWNGKKEKVGIYFDIYSSKYGEKNTVKQEDGRWHVNVPVSLKGSIKIKMPKDYDGLVIATNINSSNEERFNETRKEYNKLVDLQKAAKEDKKKQKELDQYIKKRDSSTLVYDSKKSKNTKPEDIYCIKIADVLEIEHVENKNNLLWIILTVIAIIIIAVIVSILFIVIKKKPKEDTKKEKAKNKESKEKRE